MAVRVGNVGHVTKRRGMERRLCDQEACHGAPVT